MAHNLFSRWRYSTRILFSGCDQDVYQQDIVVHRSAGQNYEEESGGLKIWHIFTGLNCRADYGDLRFSDRHGAELPYYLWPDYTSDSARFCVRLEGADQAGTLVLHHGSPPAQTTSDGDATFQFFDDFPGTSLDASKWTIVQNNGISVSGGELIIQGGGSSSFGEIQTKSAIGPNCLISTRLSSRTYYTAIGLGASDKSGVGSSIGLVEYNDYESAIYSGSAYGSPAQWVPPRVRSGSSTYGDLINDPPSGYYDEDFAVPSGEKLKQRRNGGSWTTSTRYNGISVALPLHISHYLYYAALHLDYVLVRTYSAAPPSLLRTSRGANPSYAGLSRLLLDDVIRFAGTGSVQVLDDEIYSVAGAGGFSIETSVRSVIQVAGAGAPSDTLHLTPGAADFGGTGAAASEPAHLHTPIDIEQGVGSAYVAPSPVQFDVSKYLFESLIISRSAQDALWKCDGKIDGLQAPLAYKAFDIKVPDHNGTLQTIFFGFVPGRDYIQAVANNKSMVQGYDAGFYLTRQYLPAGDLSYPADCNWTPLTLIKYWLGEETMQASSHSRWEQVTGILPYRIQNPTSYGHDYTAKDWLFQPKTTKMWAIQEVCEYSGMVFLVKWKRINGVLTPCAYFVHQDDIDDSSHGLDLPEMATFTSPDPCIIDPIRVTLRSDEKYNRVIVRSSSPLGAWFECVKETPALSSGDELPIEYLEERSDMPEYDLVAARAQELYDYYTKYAYTYSLTLIDRTDLELYQRCQFNGFDAIPDGETMRIVAIRYVVKVTRTEVQITVTPDTRLCDLRRLQRSQQANCISEIQTIAQSQIDMMSKGECGTVTGVSGGSASVDLERGDGTKGRIT